MTSTTKDRTIPARAQNRLADAIEDASIEEARMLLDALAVYQGHDLAELRGGDCDPEYEAEVHRIIEAFEAAG